jgi:hypothetical protein
MVALHDQSDEYRVEVRDDGRWVDLLLVCRVEVCEEGEGWIQQ